MEVPRLAAKMTPAILAANPRRYGRLHAALLVGALVGITGTVFGISEWGHALEEDVGLAALFALRGPLPIPPDVAVIAIDRDTATRLRQPAEPRRWPRALHAQLVQRLSAAGAAVVVFDMDFREPRAAEDDQRFATALARAGNVILFGHLHKEHLASPGGSALVLERTLPPIDPLARAARATAPFPLPKLPIRVNRFWAYKTSAGEAATLPVAALHLYAERAYDTLQRTGNIASLPPRADLNHFTRALRQHLRKHPDDAARVRSALFSNTTRDASTQRLRALIEAAAGPDYHYLNLYGPPRTIETIPYHRAIEPSAPLALRDKVVFVGFAERRQPEQKDNFYTVYSQHDGSDLSGVEILATAFANLLEQRTLRPLSQPALAAFLMFAGLTLGLLATLPGTRVAFALVFVGGAAYVLFAHLQFAAAARWYPLFVPLLMQVPSALVAGLLVRHAQVRRERSDIRRAFGYYLPEHAIEELVRHRGPVEDINRLVYGVCLTTDVAGYSTVAERLSPDELGRLMNRYYETVFEPVRRHGGIVSDVVGDAMVALWVDAHGGPELRQRACRAALEIHAAVADFNRGGGPALPTRLGIHTGEVLLGHVGALGHYEYRAVGDIVNTASRLQALGRTLGVPLIASAATLDGIETRSRRLGVFVLHGKTVPLAVHQLDADDISPELEREFAAALRLFYDRRFADAGAAFAALWAAHCDKPSAFYRDLAERYRTVPNTWNGAVDLRGD